jgi:hypothetical protein
MGFAKVDNRPMDRFRLRPGGRRAGWTRPAAVALALAALAAGFALPARATPGRSGPTSLAAARAEAARLQREVARLDVKVETLAEAPRPQPDRRAHRPRPGRQAVPVGGDGPATFDRFGLVRFAYAHAGLSLPRTSRQQWPAGRHVQVADLRPGDLVFFAHDPARPATIHHVAMCVGQGLMVHAPPHRGAGPGGRPPPGRLHRRHPAGPGR